MLPQLKTNYQHLFCVANKTRNAIIVFRIIQRRTKKVQLGQLGGIADIYVSPLKINNYSRVSVAIIQTSGISAQNTFQNYNVNTSVQQFSSNWKQAVKSVRENKGMARYDATRRARRDDFLPPAGLYRCRPSLILIISTGVYVTINGDYLVFVQISLDLKGQPTFSPFSN